VMRVGPRGGTGGLYRAVVCEVGPEGSLDGSGCPGGSAPAVAGVPEVLCNCGPLQSSGMELPSSKGITSGTPEGRGNFCPPEAELPPPLGVGQENSCLCPWWEGAPEKRVGLPLKEGQENTCVHG
jgi:hypothetical protein